MERIIYQIGLIGSTFLFYLFVIFIAIGVIVYSFYKDQQDAVKNLELQITNYVTWLQREQNISSSLEKENLKLRKEIQTLRQNKNKEESKEISW